MKLRFLTTLFDVWIATIFSIPTNKGVLFIIALGAFVSTWQDVNSHVPLLIAALIFLYHLFMLSLICFVLISLAVPFMKLRGIIGEHAMEIGEEGLLEVTDVNRSVYFYSEVGRVRRLFGVCRISAGPGVFTFRPKNILEGDIEIFAKALSEKIGSGK